MVTLRDLWNKREPHRPGHNFDKYFKHTYKTILNRDSYPNNIWFFKDYEDSFGWHPYLPPSSMNRWKHGKGITEEKSEHAAEQVSDFKQWFEKEVLGRLKKGCYTTVACTLVACYTSMARGRPGWPVVLWTVHHHVVTRKVMIRDGCAEEGSWSHRDGTGSCDRTANPGGCKVG